MPAALKAAPPHDQLYWNKVNQLLDVDVATGDELGLMRRIRARLPVSAVHRLEQEGIGKLWTRLVIPLRTLEHRRARNEPLTVDESARAYRLAHVLALAESVFGERERALAWLSSPKRRFDGDTPLALLDTDLGARMVEEALIQLDEGYAA